MKIPSFSEMTQLLRFWFSPPISEHWFKPTPDIDQLITDNYESLWLQAKSGEMDDWKQNPGGCLALCILLDQMPLNMFRGTAKSYSTEQQAVSITKHAIKQGFDHEIREDRVSFLYMPLMHSENLHDQDLAIACFEKMGLENNLRFAKHHRGIIEEFGRFPHRNDALGRENSAAEIDYLNSNKAFKG